MATSDDGDWTESPGQVGSLQLNRAGAGRRWRSCSALLPYRCSACKFYLRRSGFAVNGLANEFFARYAMAGQIALGNVLVRRWTLLFDPRRMAIEPGSELRYLIVEAEMSAQAVLTPIGGVPGGGSSWEVVYALSPDGTFYGIDAIDGVWKIGDASAFDKTISFGATKAPLGVDVSASAIEERLAALISNHSRVDRIITFVIRASCWFVDRYCAIAFLLIAYVASRRLGLLR